METYQKRAEPDPGDGTMILRKETEEYLSSYSAPVTADAQALLLSCHGERRTDLATAWKIVPQKVLSLEPQKGKAQLGGA